MTNNDLTAEVSAELRRDIAAARERAELVEAIEGSQLWNRLTAACWECATLRGPFVRGVHTLCDACDSAERREYREQETVYRDREGVVRVREG